MRLGVYARQGFFGYFGHEIHEDGTGGEAQVLWTMKRVCLTCAVAVFAIGAMAAGADANENAAAEGVPTFNADVASILYESCANCHRMARSHRCR